MPRLDAAVITRDGDAQIVNIGRPATLMAFADQHDGRDSPQTLSELMWAAHHALELDTPLADWARTLELCSTYPYDVQLARLMIAGGEQGEHARAVVMGEVEGDDELMRKLIDAQLLEGAAAAAGTPPTVPTAGDGRSPA